jgi:hypothetical protein
MHWISDSSRQRSGYVYRNNVGYPVAQAPEINWRHIDGPLLYYSDGQLHWLTFWERFRCWIGRDDAASIQARRRPELRE